MNVFELIIFLNGIQSERKTGGQSPLKVQMRLRYLIFCFDCHLLHETYNYI